MNYLLFSLTVTFATCYEENESNFTLDQWENYKENYNKWYPPEEDAERLKIIRQKYRDILLHNEKFQKGEFTFSRGLNQYSDLTYDEIRANLTGYRKYEYGRRSIFYIPNADSVLPTSINWVEKGMVSPVKDQGLCAASFIYAVVGAVESAYSIKQKKLVELSFQNALDCFVQFKEPTCTGGDIPNVYRFIQFRGIESEEDYPFIGERSKCKYDPKKVLTRVKSYWDVFLDSEISLRQAVGGLGPVVVAMNADLPSFMDYQSGVYNDKQCRKKKLTHAMLVVGYGKDAATGLDYWLLKNSWGTSWGVEGYMKLAKGRRNFCGIASEATIPVV